MSIHALIADSERYTSSRNEKHDRDTVQPIRDAIAKAQDEARRKGTG